MKIGKGFHSHKELWMWLPPDVRIAKNARHNICGDVYEPKPSLRDPFAIQDYWPPAETHVHKTDKVWYKDINYSANYKKIRERPALLVDDPESSFLWSQPMIYITSKLPRLKKWNRLQDFMDALEGK